MIIFWIAVFIIFCFGVVIFVGAPYLPTLKAQQEKALALLDLKKDETLLELGCGDGRVLLAAAKQGLRGVGYELNPLLFVVAKIVTWRYRNQIRIHFGNYWHLSWPACEGIYVFLLDKYMPKLSEKISQEYNGKRIKVVSLAFAFPGHKPLKTDTSLYLYNFDLRKSTKI